MAHFNLDNYETVEDRLVKFWHDHPDGRIATMMEDITADKTMVVFRCDVYFHADDHKAKASGYAEETRNSSPVNKTSFVENCETSAIGRALANCGYAAKGSRHSSLQHRWSACLRVQQKLQQSQHRLSRTLELVHHQNKLDSSSPSSEAKE